MSPDFIEKLERFMEDNDEVMRRLDDGMIDMDDDNWHCCEYDCPQGPGGCDECRDEEPEGHVQ
jgi:hypothetical protein